VGFLFDRYPVHDDPDHSCCCEKHDQDFVEFYQLLSHDSSRGFDSLVNPIYNPAN